LEKGEEKNVSPPLNKKPLSYERIILKNGFTIFPQLGFIGMRGERLKSNHWGDNTNL